MSLDILEQFRRARPEVLLGTSVVPGYGTLAGYSLMLCRDGQVRTLSDRLVRSLDRGPWVSPPQYLRFFNLPNFLCDVVASYGGWNEVASRRHYVDLISDQTRAHEVFRHPKVQSRHWMREVLPVIVREAIEAEMMMLKEENPSMRRRLKLREQYAPFEENIDNGLTPEQVPIGTRCIDTETALFAHRCREAAEKTLVRYARDCIRKCRETAPAVSGSE